MNKKFLLLIGITMILTAGSVVAASGDLFVTPDDDDWATHFEWNDAELIPLPSEHFETPTLLLTSDEDRPRSTGSHSPVNESWEYLSTFDADLFRSAGPDSPFGDTHYRPKSKPQPAQQKPQTILMLQLHGAAKTAREAVVNIVSPSHSKKYQKTPKIGLAHTAANWSMLLGGPAFLHAIKKAIQKAHADVAAENKEKKIPMTPFQLRKAAVARAWKNFRTTKLVDQKALVGSGALFTLGVVAKLILSNKTVHGFLTRKGAKPYETLEHEDLLFNDSGDAYSK